VYILCNDNVFNEPLRRSDRVDTHGDGWEGSFNYAVEMGSDAMICISGFIKIGSGSHKLIEEET
jgi:hypothetical protein